MFNINTKIKPSVDYVQLAMQITLEKDLDAPVNFIDARCSYYIKRFTNTKL
jgi:hypothetical protein